MQYILAVVDFLKGKKAYITGGLMVILGIVNSDNDMIMQGMSVIFLRAGIAKSNQ